MCQALVLTVHGWHGDCTYSMQQLQLASAYERVTYDTDAVLATQQCLGAKQGTRNLQSGMQWYIQCATDDAYATIF